MSEVTASSNISSPYVSSLPGSLPGIGIAAAAKRVVDSAAVILQQRALADGAASRAELFRRNVAAVRALYVGKA